MVATRTAIHPHGHGHSDASFVWPGMYDEENTPQYRHVAHQLAANCTNRIPQHDRDNARTALATSQQLQLHKHARKTNSSLTERRQQRAQAVCRVRLTEDVDHQRGIEGCSLGFVHHVLEANFTVVTFLGSGQVVP